MKKAKTLT